MFSASHFLYPYGRVSLPYVVKLTLWPHININMCFCVLAEAVVWTIFCSSCRKYFFSSCWYLQGLIKTVSLADHRQHIIKTMHDCRCLSLTYKYEKQIVIHIYTWKKKRWFYIYVYTHTKATTKTPKTVVNATFGIKKVQEALQKYHLYSIIGNLPEPLIATREVYYLSMSFYPRKGSMKHLHPPPH